MKHQITTRQIEAQITKLKNAIGILHPHTEISDVAEAEHTIKTVEEIVNGVIEFLETRKGQH